MLKLRLCGERPTTWPMVHSSVCCRLQGNGAPKSVACAGLNWTWNIGRGGCPKNARDKRDYVVPLNSLAMGGIEGMSTIGTDGVFSTKGQKASGPFRWVVSGEISS